MFCATLERERIEFAEPASGEPATLAEALHQLDILPFSFESVQRYKARKLFWADSFGAVGRYVGKLVPEPILITAIVLGLVGLVYVAGMGTALLIYASVPGWISVALAGFLAMAVTGAVFFEYGSRSEPRWRTIRYSAYDGKIPDSVEQTVSIIKGKWPQATFEVEYFDLDPFLTVHDRSATFYVAAWDEKGFVIG